MAFTKEQIEAEAITIVRNEVTTYEDVEVFVTDRVAFAMKPLIRTLRKNYWGIFDKPKDPVSGHSKIWVPLTRQVVDTVRKNIDVDPKDFNFRSKTRKGRATTDFLRGIVREFLDNNFFGEVLDQSITQLAIDGTLVWKTISDEKGNPIQRVVDILNIYIDPTAKNIQEAYRFTERALLTKDKLKQMDGWRNVDDAQPRPGLNPNDPRLDMTSLPTTSRFVEVFEMWGKIPEWLITGDDNDKEEIDGHIVVSSARQGQHGVVHLIERNDTKDKDGNIIKPYEECWYLKVPGRWYGVGPAEMVMALQVWVNTIVNIRINRNRVAQLGLFKVRTGSGITRQMVNRLTSNGVIKVKSMDDVEQFQVQEAQQGSYTDEEVAVNWARLVTSASAQEAGQQMPASQTATSAVIGDRNVKSSFTLVREGIGVFLQRWSNRHLLPGLGKKIKKNMDVRIYGDIDNIQKLRERVANGLVMERVQEEAGKGNIPREEDILRAVRSTRERLEDDEDLFFKLVDDVFISQMDTKIYFTNQEFNPAVMADKIITTMQIAPELRPALLGQLTDILGLEIPGSVQSQMQQAQPQPGQAQQTNQSPVSSSIQAPRLESEQEMNTNAMTNG